MGYNDDVVWEESPINIIKIATYPNKVVSKLKPIKKLRKL